MMKYFASVILLASTSLAAPHAVQVESRAEQLFKRAGFVETPSSCVLPSGYTPPASNAKLPDPFTFANGSKVVTNEDMLCRAGEISDMFQKYELGTKTPKPSNVTATMSGTGISVSVASGGKTITFSAKISKGSCKAPCPAIIGIGGVSIPVPAGVATITFDNDGMAAQQSSSSHGTGLFFQLFGSSANAGATTAWGWGVSRLIDGLEAVGAATSGIDTTRLGVSGCSRNGKGAFIVGALDGRIALTIPQESGSGGAACWRISDSQKASGANIQTASEIIGENAWFSPVFNTYAKATSTLPHDHHMLAAMVAPRGLFVIENDIDWLGPVSTTGCQEVGQLIYKAMGIPINFGFSLVGGHSHCAFPSSQSTDLNAYITKFLLGGSGPTAQVQKSSASVTLSSYYTWSVPTLT